MSIIDSINKFLGRKEKPMSIIQFKHGHVDDETKRMTREEAEAWVKKWMNQGSEYMVWDHVNKVEIRIDPN